MADGTFERCKLEWLLSEIEIVLRRPAALACGPSFYPENVPSVTGFQMAEPAGWFVGERVLAGKVPRVALPLTREFQYRDFRSGAEADGEAGGADAAVDVELPAGFFEPSTDVGRLQAAEGEAAVDEIE